MHCVQLPWQPDVRKGTGLLYRFNKWWHIKWAQIYVRNRLPHVARVQDRTRLDGGLVGDYQFLRLWELWQILQTLHPQNALELGAGASSAVFANYFRDASKFTTVEESPKWRERTLEALGSYTSYVTCLLASRCITTLDSEIVCYYDMDHTGSWDLVYVDGPTNIAPDGLLSVDGKTPHLANADVELFWKNGQYPRFIVVDGRRNTVRRFILSGSNDYQVLLKTDYLPRTSLFEALSFRYHTLLLRCVPSGQ